MHPKNLRSYLSDGISSLLPQARRLLELRQILAESMPENLRRSSSIANYKQGKVVIFADNSAVAAKLKLLAPTLTGVLVKNGFEVTGMQVEVQPKSPLAEAKPKHANLSETAAAELTKLSDQLPDSQLKSSILSLAGKARSKH
jgi:hypothetical protein